MVSFTSNAYLELELLDHMAVLFLFFLRNLKISLFMVALQICISNNTGGRVVKNLPANAGGPRI